MSNNRLKIISSHLTEVKLNSVMANSTSPLTTHILDVSRGNPAKDVPLTLYRLTKDNEWQMLIKRCTNEDGRCPGLISKDQFVCGTYKITFDTATYFSSINTKGFYPFVDVVFEVEKPTEHHHVPLLLSPFGYSTYRGS